MTEHRHASAIAARITAYGAVLLGAAGVCWLAVGRSHCWEPVPQAGLYLWFLGAALGCLASVLVIVALLRHAIRREAIVPLVCALAPVAFMLVAIAAPEAAIMQNLLHQCD